MLYLSQFNKAEIESLGPQRESIKLGKWWKDTMVSWRFCKTSTVNNQWKLYIARLENCSALSNKSLCQRWFWFMLWWLGWTLLNRLPYVFIFLSVTNCPDQIVVLLIQSHPLSICFLWAVSDVSNHILINSYHVYQCSFQKSLVLAHFWKLLVTPQAEEGLLTVVYECRLFQ